MNSNSTQQDRPFFWFVSIVLLSVFLACAGLFLKVSDMKNNPTCWSTWLEAQP